MTTKSPGWKYHLLPIGLIIMVSAITFLPLANRLGFYRDDWYMLWSANTRGANSIIDLFSIDRPFMGYTYNLIYRLLGNSPLPWQLYAFALKTLGAMALYGIVRLMWPGQKRAATAAALIYLVYPGFLQQPNAATLTNHLLSLTAELVSIYLSGLAILSQPKWTRYALIIPSALLGLLNFMLYEYMLGLEVLRLCVLWLVLQPAGVVELRSRFRRLLSNWWPYLAVLAGFLVWRLGFFKSGRVGTNQTSILTSFLNNPRDSLVHLGLESIMDPIETVIVAWGLPFEQYATLAKPRLLTTALFLGVILAAVVLLVMRLEKRWSVKPDGGRESSRSICMAGAVSLYGALFPVLAAGRDVHFFEGFDRYALHASPAVAIIMVGFLFGAIRGRIRQLILGLLLLLGVATQILNAYHWAQLWEHEKALWWQLWWRAPALQDGTTLLASIQGEGFFEDYEVWGPANLIYYPLADTVQVGAEVLNTETIYKMWAGSAEERGMRGLSYGRDFNKSLLLALPDDSSCLKVVDREELLLPLRFEARLIPLLRFSHVEQIDLTMRSAAPPAAIFGPEPAHEWCFYYQSAEQAKQAGDWEGVVRTGDEAITAGKRPVDRAEWLPFLEGYLWAMDEGKTGYVAGEIKADTPLVKQICEAVEGGPFRFGVDIQQALIVTLCNE